jgi:hypothetical protein
MTRRRPRPPTLFDDPADEPAPERAPFDLDAYLARIASWKPYAVRRRPGGDDHEEDDEHWTDH